MKRKKDHSVEKKMMRLFNRTARHWKKVLGSSFPDDDVTTIMDRAREEYRALIPRLPDVGDNLNPLADNIIETALMLAYYKVLKTNNRNLDAIKAICHDVIRERIAFYPTFLLRLRGIIMSSARYQKKKKEMADWSQQKKYPGDWVFSFVEGDGDMLLYGVDYTECGICKLLEAEGAPEFIPVLCEIDFITFDAYGMHFSRTKTLGGGDDLCDFRFIREKQ